MHRCQGRGVGEKGQGTVSGMGDFQGKRPEESSEHRSMERGPVSAECSG